MEAEEAVRTRATSQILQRSASTQQLLSPRNPSFGTSYSYSENIHALVDPPSVSRTYNSSKSHEYSPKPSDGQDNDSAEEKHKIDTNKDKENLEAKDQHDKKDKSKSKIKKMYPDSIKEGYLFKKSESRFLRPWNRRYFVLRRDILEYYDSHTSSVNSGG